MEKTKKLIARPATRLLASLRCQEHVADISMGRSKDAKFFRKIQGMRVGEYCAEELQRKAVIDALRDGG